MDPIGSQASKYFYRKIVLGIHVKDSVECSSLKRKLEEITRERDNLRYDLRTIKQLIYEGPLELCQGCGYPNHPNEFNPKRCSNCGEWEACLEWFHKHDIQEVLPCKRCDNYICQNCAENWDDDEEGPKCRMCGSTD